MGRFGTRDANGRRIARVLAHLHENLDQELDLHRLAQVACVSPFHFHRLYHAATGETLNATLSRLRLHRAAVALDRTEQPLASIALQAGYGSKAAFSRAFAAAHGRPPFRFRQKRREGVPQMTGIVVQDRAAMTLLVSEHEGAPHLIGRAFDRLVAWAGPRGPARRGNGGSGDLPHRHGPARGRTAFACRLFRPGRSAFRAASHSVPSPPGWPPCGGSARGVIRNHRRCLARGLCLDCARRRAACQSASLRGQPQQSTDDAGRAPPDRGVRAASRALRRPFDDQRGHKTGR